MPKAAKASGKTRHDPLHVQLGEDEAYAKYGKVSRPGKRHKSRAIDEDEENGEVSPTIGYALHSAIDIATGYS